MLLADGAGVRGCGHVMPSQLHCDPVKNEHEMLHVHVMLHVQSLKVSDQTWYGH